MAIDLASFLATNAIYVAGVCTLWWLYMDITMENFHVFFSYKKINKIRSIEIIIKKTHLSKSIIITLSKMKKSNQNLE
jgi:hypothetical protein